MGHIYSQSHNRLSQHHGNSHGIIQFYLPPERGDVHAITPVKASTWLTDSWRMKGWVSGPDYLCVSITSSRILRDDEESQCRDSNLEGLDLPITSPARYTQRHLKGQLTQNFNLPSVRVWVVGTNLRTESCFLSNKLTNINIKSSADAGKNPS